MANLKIKTDERGRAGSKVIFPVIGKVAFDDLSQAQVEDSKEAREMINSREDLYFVDSFEKSEKPQKNQSDGSDQDENKKSEGNTEDTDENQSDETSDDNSGQENDPSKIDLEKLNKDKIQEICKEFGLPEEEWKDLKKEDLISYVRSKY